MGAHPLLVVLASACAALAGCADSAAPERRCTSHTQCDDGFLCGEDGLCRPSVDCAGDDDCCPGSVCFSGWCRPTPECFIGDRCPGLGEVCELRPGLAIAGAAGLLGDATRAGLCVPEACDPLGGCASPLTCIGGRCLLGTPCGGRCAAGTVCEPVSDRCLPAPGPCECPGGTALATALSVSPTSCGLGTYQCACARLPAVPPGLPGVDGRLIPGEGGDLPALVSYEPEYGDLVLSRFFDSAGRQREDIVVDGVPSVPAAAEGVYRDGVLDPGPDRGARPAVAPRAGGGADLVYRDLDRRRVMFARIGPTGVREAIGDLPIEGLDVGRYSCLARRADGRLAGLVFVSADPGDTVSLLLRLESRVVDPVSGDDWTVSPVLETRLPPRDEHPCGDACGFGQTCVVAGGAPACADVIALSGLGGVDPCGGCGPHEVCATVAGESACRPVVYRRYEADRLPFGEGLYASCAASGGDVFAAWYDHDRRRLVAARWPFSAGDRVEVAAGPGRDPGRFASIALDGARIGIAHQDAARATLEWAEAASWGAAFASEVLPSGDGGEPGVGARALWFSGRPAVVHLDGRSGAVEVVARGGGCWERQVVLSAGGHAHPAAVAGGEGIWVAARALSFEETTLAPRHAPVLALVAPPGCAP